MSRGEFHKEWLTIRVCRYLREKARPHGGRTLDTAGVVLYSSESQRVVDEERGRPCLRVHIAM